ncbi:MAG: hypothetical protein K2M89_06200 [Clostridiales bacterium]|nr:hypothetical protein [Clostridiales bacterium]
MTYDKRSEILSKDYLTIADMQDLLGLSYNDAAKLIREIKRKHNRLNTRGKIHIQDYIDYYQLDAIRYQPVAQATKI